MTRQFNDLRFASAQQQTLHDVRPKQVVNCRCVTGKCLADRDSRGQLLIRGPLFRSVQFNCTGFVALRIVSRSNSTGASLPVNILY